MIRVKICCISSKEEAALAVRYGASALGLVGHMPSGPGVIDDALIQEITNEVPPGVATFLLTSETSSQKIIEHHRRVNTNTIQIVDALTAGSYAAIKKALPSVKIVQVIHVIDQSSVDEAIAIAPMVDAILLDSGNPNLKVKELGGTGRTHNWSLSKQIRSAVNVPVYLAGGIKASNVQQAIKGVQPFGVDLCSSVRSEGKLDEEKLKAFFAAVNALL